MKKIFLLAFSIIMVLSLVACKQNPDAVDSTSPEVNNNQIFKIGAIPDLNAAELARGYDDFAKYLSEKTGLTVEYVPSVDYAALVTGFERGEIHMAWFGGLTGVQARAVVPEAEAIAQRPSDAEFKSVFIQQKGLGLTKLEDLKGFNFSFGSESSTSGHLMPRYFMQEAGIDPDTNLDGKPNYSGSHDKTYKLVESGAFQTGAVNIQYWEKAVEENAVDLDKVEAFYTTPEYFDYNWTINDVDKIFGDGTKTKVKDTLLSMERKDSLVMDLLSTDSFIETNNSNYDSIKNVAKKLGIIQ